jgi:hypothetical protein
LLRVHTNLHGSVDPVDPSALPGLFPRLIRPPPVFIRASRREVWDVLCHLEAYPQGCPFTRRIVTSWELGSPVEVQLGWDPQRLGPAVDLQVERLVDAHAQPRPT